MLHNWYDLFKITFFYLGSSKINKGEREKKEANSRFEEYQGRQDTSPKANQLIKKLLVLLKWPTHTNQYRSKFLCLLLLQAMDILLVSSRKTRGSGFIHWTITGLKKCLFLITCQRLPWQQQAATTDFAYKEKDFSKVTVVFSFLDIMPH